MASRSAKPRDLGQELDQLKSLVRRLMTGAMSRPPLRVTAGDFEVSGGGGVTVTDQGYFRSLWPNGVPSAVFGPLYWENAAYGTGLLVQSDTADDIFLVQKETVSGDTSVYADANWIALQAPLITLYDIPTLGASDYTIGYNNATGLCFVTSSARYKQDIAPATIDPAKVLDIEPVTFRDITAVEKNGDDAKTNFGVIAEQLHDLGLGDLLVTYNEDGQPDAVKYDRIALAMLPVMKAQQAQIDALTARLDVLEQA